MYLCPYDVSQDSELSCIEIAKVDCYRLLLLIYNSYSLALLPERLHMECTQPPCEHTLKGIVTLVSTNERNVQNHVDQVCPFCDSYLK